MYCSHSLSKRSLLNACSIPETKSSQYSSPSALTLPALPLPTEVNCNVANLFGVPISIARSAALVLSISKLGNTSCHKYSPSAPIIRKHSSYTPRRKELLWLPVSIGLSGNLPASQVRKNIAKVVLPTPGGILMASTSSFPSANSCRAIATGFNCLRRGR